MRISDWSSDVCSSDLEQCSKKDRQIRRKCELIVSQEIEHAAENMRELNPRKDRSPELTDQLVQILGEPITVNFRISSPFEQHVRDVCCVFVGYSHDKSYQFLAPRLCESADRSEVDKAHILFPDKIGRAHV